ncbi:MAG: hypothetical protein ACRDBO_12225 [Lachnospiraceae bacterium]
MKKMKFAAALLTIAAMAINVTGCGAKFDPKTYVQGSLDAQFKNEISDEFAKITEGGKEAIQAQYDENIEELNALFVSMGCPDEMVDEFKVATQDLLKACKYTVGDAVKGDDGNYTVPVEIEPIQFMTEEMQAEMQAHLMQKIAELGEAADEETIMNETFAFMLDKFKEAAANPVYGEAQTIDVRVQEVSKNLYDIPVKDQEALSNAVFGL